jgi:hypothetical protein
MRHLLYASILLVALVLAAVGGATASSLITGRQIKNHSIHNVDLASDTRGRDGADGLDGANGGNGAPGPQGPPGISRITYVQGPGAFQCASGSGSCAVVQDTAPCPGGTTVIGGGFTGGSINNGVGYLGPNGNGWAVVDTNDSSFAETIKAIAVCAQVSGAAGRSVPRSDGAAARAYAAAREAVQP